MFCIRGLFHHISLQSCCSRSYCTVHTEKIPCGDFSELTMSTTTWVNRGWQFSIPHKSATVSFSRIQPLMITICISSKLSLAWIIYQRLVLCSDIAPRVIRAVAVMSPASGSAVSGTVCLFLYFLCGVRQLENNWCFFNHSVTHFWWSIHGGRWPILKRVSSADTFQKPDFETRTIPL